MTVPKFSFGFSFPDFSIRRVRLEESGPWGGPNFQIFLKNIFVFRPKIVLSKEVIYIMSVGVNKPVRKPDAFFFLFSK